MIYKDFKDIKLSRLGMGNMRLPRVNNEPKGPIDYPAAKKMIDTAMKAGINYYDTAYVYYEKTSENFLGEALKEYSRDSYYLATKFYIRSNPDYKAVFEEQLAKLQSDYIDFYLVHCLMDDSYDEYVNSGCIEYFQQLKNYESKSITRFPSKR
jgi:predicted aldo/keto reductase-like oxidoreductase